MLVQDQQQTRWRVPNGRTHGQTHAFTSHAQMDFFTMSCTATATNLAPFVYAASTVCAIDSPWAKYISDHGKVQFQFQAQEDPSISSRGRNTFQTTGKARISNTIFENLWSQPASPQTSQHSEATCCFAVMVDPPTPCDTGRFFEHVCFVHALQQLFP